MISLLDIRERDLIPLMPNWPVKMLPIGDLWIGVKDEEIQEGSIIAERKTVTDFESSFLDGRYREQRTRLLAYCSEKKAKPFYIIEGSFDRTQQRLEKKALWKLLTRLSLRYGIGLFFTKSLEETAELGEILLEQWKEDPKVFQGETVSYAETLHVNKKDNTSQVVQTMMIAQVPGISVKTAQALLLTHKTFESVFKATEAELAATQVTETRKFGAAAAKKLWTALHVAIP
jgi:ERCC4-type nuclease